MKLPEIFVGQSQPPRPNISTGFYSPGVPAPCTSMRKPCVGVEGLGGSVKPQKESDRVTL